ncbi:hypothetical protein C5167_030558 [Papaver somniferum]|uniref:UDP-glycosyltransferase 87A1-like n=1 Tax=Papaver somniferum TaxID=3469 RepID=UPI000E6F975A|nr:UDP-glycosyltransferase 87A1-like [Papaver somniferum]RZC86480.1 hypothetical protein C5167_030558 [Papaver somniferum]
MEEINQQEPKSMERCHIIAVPFPARGLINPMMNFCKHLAHKLGDNVKITFVVTEEWFGILDLAPIPPQIHLQSIPNVIPSEFVRSSTLDFETFLAIVVAEMQAPFENVMNTSEPVTVIIADFSLIWALSIGNRRNIPVVSFWTASSFMFSVLSHADLLTKNGHSLDHSSDCDDEVINYIPGVSPTRLTDMPLLPRGNDPKFNPEMVAFTLLDKVQCLIIPTFYELEPQVTDTLKEIFRFPVYTIGPSISNLDTTINQHHQIHDKKKESATIKYTNSEELYYLKWLDSQPINSVMYIAFGSTVSISGEQMEEILSGLHESGVLYLLVSRGAGYLTSGIHGGGGGDRDEKTTSSRRLVVPWCDQLRVLCHSSVGGFWTHCGWNSVMESIYAGVPMLTFPIYFDQIPNRKLIVDDLKVGMKVMNEFGAKALVKRGEVEKILRKFMNINGEAEEDVNNETKEMRRRSSELKDICRKALAEGGSSDTNLNSFIKDILHFNGN